MNLLGIQVLSMVKDVTPLITAPIILFIYFNPIKARGPEKLCQQAKAAGISGQFLSKANLASVTANGECWKDPLTFMLLLRLTVCCLSVVCIDLKAKHDVQECMHQQDSRLL